MATRYRVAVTGGTGFIGRVAVAQLLDAGHEVYLLNRSPQISGGNAHHHGIDLRDSGAIADLMRTLRPDYLLHLAWVTEPKAYWTSPDNLVWVGASLSLISEFAAAGGKRVVVAGTCAEYDWRHHTMDERTTPLEPATPYGRAKASLFQIISHFAPHLGISFGWGRIFLPFGPGEKPGKLFSEALPKLIKGEPVDLTDGTQVWDLMYVDDVAGALVALLFSDVRGAVNIASGSPRTIRSAMEDFADRLGAGDLLRFGARQKPPHETPHIAASVRRLNDEVAFRPRYGWSEAVDACIEGWRRQLVSSQT